MQEAKEEGIRQGIWLCIQKLVELERFDMAKYFMISFGFNKNDDILNNINNLSLYMNGASRSSGEKNLHAMNSLFDFMFNQDEYAFPIQKLMEFKKKSNEFWANRIDNLLKYYKDNRVVLMEKDFEYTILMDEPDRNLDIDNIIARRNIDSG